MLSREEATPNQKLQEIAESPLQLFFYFLPKSFWRHVSKETNRYKWQTTLARARSIQASQKKRQGVTPEAVKLIARRLRAQPKYRVDEVLHVIGLLVAAMMNPLKGRFSKHWAMSFDGAIPAGTFGKYMARNRCTAILRDLHFVNNEAPHSRDKLWKLRPLVDVLQERFLSGWSLPAHFSFDEGVLPSTSRRNTTRMFMPDKPHRYGTKMFMVCDSDSAYCHRYVLVVFFDFFDVVTSDLLTFSNLVDVVYNYFRFEVYVGKREVADTDEQALDNKTGAAAVVRNMKIVLGDEQPQRYRLVIIDRYYSSVALAIQLLSMSL